MMASKTIPILLLIPSAQRNFHASGKERIGRDPIQVDAWEDEDDETGEIKRTSMREIEDRGAA